ncbi:hypothetical protein Glove_295g52 [Diversispora epigaea]|uniref:Uncharacterized protein n=1 Tax=Diversispora epigaea TaxID=1348612 RepID=A0A397I6E9_9GLOM|nr:hypothetical protein Glove_295g52 [Diversispora epigaea]
MDLGQVNVLSELHGGKKKAYGVKKLETLAVKERKEKRCAALDDLKEIRGKIVEETKEIPIKGLKRRK